jgi:glutaredoxin
MNENIKRKIISKAEQILEKIKLNNDTFLIFGLSTCKYCSNALNFSKVNSLQYKYYEMDKYHELFISILNKLSELNSKLNIDPNHQTFPVIFYNGKFIGGYSELTKYKK